VRSKAEQLVILLHQPEFRLEQHYIGPMAALHLLRIFLTVPIQAQWWLQVPNTQVKIY
jgi:hypothetical protein